MVSIVNLNQIIMPIDFCYSPKCVESTIDISLIHKSHFISLFRNTLLLSWQIGHFPLVILPSNYRITKHLLMVHHIRRIKAYAVLVLTFPLGYYYLLRQWSLRVLIITYSQNNVTMLIDFQKLYLQNLWYYTTSTNST